MNNETRQRTITFDPTINLGHIITFVGLLIAGAGMWMAMDKRVTVLEVYSISQRANDQRQDQDVNDTKKIMREDLKEIGTKLDKLLIDQGGGKK
jgi:hypothetical protein